MLCGRILRPDANPGNPVLEKKYLLAGMAVFDLKPEDHPHCGIGTLIEKISCHFRFQAASLVIVPLEPYPEKSGKEDK